MKSIFDNADPTWASEITVETPPTPKKQPLKASFPRVLLFAISSIAVGAVQEPPIVWKSGAAPSAQYVHEHERRASVFGEDALGRTWMSAMSVVRELGENPEDIVRRADETVDSWRTNPLGDVTEIQVDEDEV